MIKRKLIYRSIQYVLLVWLAGILPVGCQDDWDTYGEDSSGQRVTINLKLPVSLATTTDKEQEIKDAHFYAYGTDSKPIAYQKITGSKSQKIVIPVGKCDIYIVANYTGSKLNANTPRATLEGETFTIAQVIGQPFVMLGMYKGVIISREGKIMYAGTDITQNLKPERIAAKVTLNINAAETVVIDSVCINNRANASFLMPNKPYVPTNTDNNNVKLKVPANTYSFYLPEYIVDESHKKKSTYVTVYAKVGADKQTEKVYKIYIGDWFGYSKKYHEWNWEGMTGNDPSEVKANDNSGKIGIDGLSVTRNKHYIFDGTIVGPVDVTLNGTVSVKDWELINIPTDITPTASLFLSETDVVVNAIKDSVAISYETTLADISVEIDATLNKLKSGAPRFTYTIDKQNKTISFTHSTEATTYETSSGVPISVTAIVKAFQGTEYEVKKNINLFAYNPVSKENMDPQEWVYHMGYNPLQLYQLDYKDLLGKDPKSVYMDNAPAFTGNGCDGYSEGSDPQTGKGYWRLPTKEELKRVYKIVQALSVEDIGYESIGQSNWSSSEVTTDFKSSDYAYTVSSDYQEYSSPKIVNNIPARCVRDNTPLYNTGEKATYLQVSHTFYEVALGEYPGNLFSTVPIKYESDQVVDIRLLDSDGAELSSLTPTEKIDPYFLGFNVDSNAELEGKISDLWFPKNLVKLKFVDGMYSISEGPVKVEGATIKKKGKFYLFPNVQPYDEIYNVLQPYSFIPPQVNRMLYNLNGYREFTLLFSAGKNLSKTVRIRVINPVANIDYHKKGTRVPFLEALGISSSYIGYDIDHYERFPDSDAVSGFFVKSINAEKQTVASNTTLVPDMETGCATYFEGSPGDPATGKGNWYLNRAFPDILVPYVRDRLAINQSSGLRGETTTGDPVNGSYERTYNADYWRKYLGMANFSQWAEPTAVYWATADSIDQGYGFRLDNFHKGRYTKKKLSILTRCTRRINIDVLCLSDVKVELNGGYEPGSRFEWKIPFYTSSSNGVEAELFYYNKDYEGKLALRVDNTFTVYPHNSGEIVVSASEQLPIGTIANVVVNSKNDDKTQRAYRIIKVIGKQN